MSAPLNELSKEQAWAAYHWVMFMLDSKENKGIYSSSSHYRLTYLGDDAEMFLVITAL